MSWFNPFGNDVMPVKKSDDPLPAANSHHLPWQHRSAQPLRKRRVLYLFCGVLLIYLFVKNLPTDVGPHPRWADSRIYEGPLKDGKIPRSSTAPPAPEPPSKKPPRPASASEADNHYHDGPIKFYKLAASLHAVAKLGGQKNLNKNVLFAASNLKSVSELLPVACEMSQWNLNDVHLAIMGRDDMDISELKKINGIDEVQCNVHWHDARPDFSKWSTDYRMESSVAASLEHIQTFIHPQVIIIDDPKREDGFFVDATREKTIEIFKPLIELPRDATESLMWLARLDSSSLATWPRLYIDIVIQAPSGSSGSLVRLLKSINDADYFGARRPHLTVELPASIDEPTSQYLGNFLWPPVDWSGRPQTSQLTLRHRVSRKTTTAEEASARLLESFWPKNRESHVLVLSPQVELSPLYFHYLFYNVLAYRHSRSSRSNPKYGNLMGIGMHVPDTLLDDETIFTPPTSKQTKPKSKKDTPAGSRVPFLWQAPNNDAALYFGDMWKELHSFVSLRLTKPPSRTRKVVSETRPAWMEYLLELMRARGYSLLYPGAYLDDFTLSTVHDELYQIPEEFLKEPKAPTAPKPKSSATQPLEANTTRVRGPPPNTEGPLIDHSLLEFLPNRGSLLELDDVSLVSSSGEAVSFKQASDIASTYSSEFRRTIGSCEADQAAPDHKFAQAVDLFCDAKAPYDYHKAAEPSEEASEPSEPSSPEPKPKEKEKEREKEKEKEAEKEKGSSDPDKIKPSQAERAKSEKARHLDRQAGEGAAQPEDVEAYRQRMLEETGNGPAVHEKQRTAMDVEDARMKDAYERVQKLQESHGAKDAKEALKGGETEEENKEDDGGDDKNKAAEKGGRKAPPKPIVRNSKQRVEESTSDDDEDEDDDDERMPGW